MSTQGWDESRPVPTELLASLAELALRLPSEHEQPTARWIIVQSKEAKGRVAAAAYGQPLVLKAPALVVVVADLEPERVGQTWLDQRVSQGEISPEQAQRSLALAKRAPGRWPNRGLWAVRHAMQTVGSLLLAGSQAGLLVQLIADFDHGKLRMALGIPDDHEIAALLGLGIALPSGSEPTLATVNIEDLCFAEHFGQPRDGSVRVCQSPQS